MKIALPHCFTHHSLARYTSLRIGGPADYVLIPHSADELTAALQQIPPDFPVTYLGLGSNTLISDTGIRGLVIILQGSGLTRMEVSEAGIYVEAGVACGQLARFSARNDFAGLEFMAGIPGTLGGALAMNAGCYGGETWDNVRYVKTMDRQGCIHQRDKAEFSIAYREAKGCAGELFLAARFDLPKGEKAISLDRIKTLLAQRNAAQPTNFPNCGSVFRNPPGGHAARLIEACGLKGRQIGGAQISEKHANFIVNIGDAGAGDVLALIELMQSSVKEKFGIQLQKEVKVLG